ncbi:MAG: response regulator transcription factor, partial [Proteobacteria bacterium]
TNPFEAIKLVQEGQVDLVFLDIQMPELNGIQFLKICGGKCKVILTTAYTEYALEGFEHDVIDYLLKPVPYDRFYRSVIKAKLLLEKTVQNTEPAPGVVQPVVDYLFIKGDSKNKFIKVDLKDILYVEGLKNYLSVYTFKQRLITYQSLKDFESQLPDKQFTGTFSGDIKEWLEALVKVGVFKDSTYVNVGNAGTEPFYGKAVMNATLGLQINL